MKKKNVGIIVGLLLITTGFIPVTANNTRQLIYDINTIERPQSLNFIINKNLNLEKSNSLKESCDHFAYFSSNDELCWIYKLFLTPPYNTTCVCGGLFPSYPFFSSGTWTTDERLLVTEYSNGALYEIDLDNCELISIGGGGTSLNGLTYDPTSGKVYGCSSYALFEIDPETGYQELIGSFNINNAMIEIACDADGVMYGWDVLFSGSSSLYEIDKDTGEASIIGEMGTNLLYAMDGDFCRDCDILYIAANNYLFECDEDTGELYVLGLVENNFEGFFVIPDQPSQKPIAEFNWIPSFPQPGETIIFNASESYDTDGSIMLYEWDWDYDGVFDENHTTPTSTHFWEDIGDFPVTLRVTDNHGLKGKKIKYVAVREPLERPIIKGPKTGRIGVTYDYEFVQYNPECDDICYFIDWGDNTTTGWTDHYEPGKKITINHTWYEKEDYEIKAKVKDILGRVSDWETFTVTIPRYKVIKNKLPRNRGGFVFGKIPPTRLPHF